MRPSIYWLNLREPRRLAIMPRPRAGDRLADEVAGWQAEGPDIVVSLLGEHEVVEIGLKPLSASCRAAGIEFVSFPIRDRGVPDSMPETVRLVRRLSDALANAVAVHCRAGIGRSALIVRLVWS
ncbi:MAG: hypothetical protein J2P50_20490, partial [Hyphomicrobiaceae bacterium]|nr:hypothetical protein [Hyphomicrobiaceae bacterium]